MRRFFQTVEAVLQTPGDFFQSRRDEAGLATCLWFSACAFLSFGALAVLALSTVRPIMPLWWPLWWMFAAVALRLLLAFVALGLLLPFLAGLAIWIVCRLQGSRAPYVHSVRIAAYASAIMVAAAPFALGPWPWSVGLLVVPFLGVRVAAAGAKVLNFEGAPNRWPID